MPILEHATHLLQSADRDLLVRLARTFIRVEEIIDSVYDLNRLLELIMRESELAVGAETSSLLLFDPQTHELYFEVALGPKGDQIKEIRLPLDENSIAGAAGVQRIPINIPDVKADPRWNRQVDEKTEFQTRNILAVPMLRQERLIGVIEVLNKVEGDCFTDEDVDLLMVLASLAAIAIENANLYRKNIQAERLAALGHAVAGISHYIKNVLTGLKGSITLIESAVREGEYDILERAVMVMKRSYGRIQHLVRDMLSYSKGREPSPSETNPNRVVQEVYELMQESAAAKDIEILLDLEEGMPNLWLDGNILEDVILNLLTNAMDAVYEKRLTQPEFEPQVRIATRLKESSLHVSVRDNGPGIPENEQDRIWAAFYSSKGSSGTGLGLAVSRKVVEESGGRLELESEEGKGCLFTIVLPAVRMERGLGGEARG